MEQITDALETIIQQRILQAKREGYKRNFYGYRERNLEKANEYNREYVRKVRLKKKLEKEGKNVEPETLGKM
jgi:hypothetical protein